MVILRLTAYDHLYNKENGDYALARAILSANNVRTDVIGTAVAAR